MRSFVVLGMLERAETCFNSEHIGPMYSRSAKVRANAAPLREAQAILQKAHQELNLELARAIVAHDKRRGFRYALAIPDF